MDTLDSDAPAQSKEKARAVIRDMCSQGQVPRRLTDAELRGVSLSEMAPVVPQWALNRYLGRCENCGKQLDQQGPLFSVWLCAECLSPEALPSPAHEEDGSDAS